MQFTKYTMMKYLFLIVIFVIGLMLFSKQQEIALLLYVGILATAAYFDIRMREIT